MKRVLLMVAASLAILILIAVMLRWLTSDTPEAMRVKNSLSAFDALHITCPNIHEAVEQITAEGSTSGGPYAVGGLMPGYKSTGRVVGKTPDGKDMFGADGTVMVSFRPISQAIQGQRTDAGQPISAEVVGLAIDFSEFDDESLSKVCQILTLKSLKLENTQVTRAGLRSLEKLRRLKQLCITPDNRNLTDSDIEACRGELPECRLFRDAKLYNPH